MARVRLLLVLTGAILGFAPQLHALGAIPSYIKIEHTGDEDKGIATIYVATDADAVVIPKLRTDIPREYAELERWAWGMRNRVNVVDQASYAAIREVLAAKRHKNGVYGWLFFITSSHYGTMRVSERLKDGTIKSFDYTIPWFLAHDQITELDEVVTKLAPDPKFRSDLKQLLLALTNAKNGPP